MSHEFYKGVLNKAFGVGGWALVPCGEIVDLEDLYEMGKDSKWLELSKNNFRISGEPVNSYDVPYPIDTAILQFNQYNSYY